jgi:hypothetical protein
MSTGRPCSSRRAFFMRINELPHVTANAARASMCKERVDFILTKIVAKVTFDIRLASYI